MFLCDVKNLDDIALIEGDELEITYSDLHQQVEDFAKLFTSKHLIFIIGENDIATIVAYLSSVESGVVPLLLGSKTNPSQIDNLISIYKPKYIFQKIDLNVHNNYSFSSRFKGYSFFLRDVLEEIELHPDLALLLTTSGSTGSPKLVRLTKKNLTSNAISISKYLNIKSNDRAISSLPFNYSYGLSVINSHLKSGGSIVLTNKSMMEKEFWHLIKKYSVTSLAGVPYNYEMILRLGIDRLKIPSITKMTQAGGKLSNAKIYKINAALKQKKISFYTMYGQTEATARVSYLSPSNIDKKPGSIGKVIPGGKIWIQDKQGQIIEQIDSIGELVYSGENVSMGYAISISELKLGDLNKGILRTGDLARFDNDGYFYIEGSTNRFVKIYGNRVSLYSLEKIILSKGFESAVIGENNNLLIYVIQNKNLSLEKLISEVSQEININHNAIKIKIVSDFPRLTNGKIDYKGMQKIK
ncbi:AMP-binding protein [Candidatus Thioglobus sp.]|nr:AMP-binding protein [Candidatus Thioglobus sp.]MDA9060381.1 AMP-binding protein [Candidatus Thioglobus sp.]